MSKSIKNLEVLKPYIILICVLFIGIGFAFTAPAWTAIVPELVSVDPGSGD